MAAKRRTSAGKSKSRSAAAKKAAATRAKERARIIREERAAERAYQAERRKRSAAAKKGAATRAKNKTKARAKEREELKQYWETRQAKLPRGYRVGKAFERGAIPAHLVKAYQRLVRRESGKRITEKAVLSDPRFQQLIADIKRSRSNMPWAKRAQALTILGLRQESWMWPVGETPR